MNRETYERIKANPFYKPSPKQRKEMLEFEKKPMAEFGVINKHDTTFEKHDTGQKKLKRKRK
jgi:GH43 family beta-xylosidase